VDIMKNGQWQKPGTFADVARDIRAGKISEYRVGDAITTRHAAYVALVWEVVGINADKATDGAADTLTVLLRNPPLWRCFDTATKAHRFGCNEWESSDIRKWM
jgi:hypothetical protein